MKIRKLIPNKEAIHCRTEEEMKCLQDNGYFYNHSFEYPIWIRITYGESSSWMPEKPNNPRYHTGKEYYENEGLTCLEFDDIVLPEESEMTAIELLEWLGQHFDDIELCAEVFGKEYCTCSITGLIEHMEVDEIIRRIKEWNKSNNSKENIMNELEIEMVYVCVIRDIGSKDSAHEEVIDTSNFDDSFPFFSELENKAKAIFKEFVTEMNSYNYEMVIERVYTIKE